MKTLVLTFCAFMCALTVSGQHLFIDTAKQNKLGNMQGQIVMLGQWEAAELQSITGFAIDNSDELPQLARLDTIQKKDFEKYKKKYNTRINTDSSLVKWTDTSFIITTEKSIDTFNTVISSRASWYYYKGLLEPLNLYIIEGIDGHNEVGWMTVQDKKTGKAFYLESPSDYPIEALCISPSQTFLLGYVNDLYDGNGFLSIMKINKNKSTYTFTQTFDVHIAKTYIEELVWIDENSFAIKAMDVYTGDDAGRPRHYLKVSFDK